jgi:hypothetical protein
VLDVEEEVHHHHRFEIAKKNVVVHEVNDVEKRVEKRMELGEVPRKGVRLRPLPIQIYWLVQSKLEQMES